MTLEDLKKYDGKEGRPAYIAYKGNVYDVTNSKLWKEGTHLKLHQAGTDLTTALGVAPHSDDRVLRMPFVGKLRDTGGDDNKPTTQQLLQSFYAKWHFHPMLVHFPMGLIPFATLMHIIFLLTNNQSFFHAGYYAILVGLLGAFAAIGSGLFSWVINYNAGMNKYFKIKISFSLMLVALLILEVLAYRMQTVSMSYYTVGVFLNMVVLVPIGYSGGKITWPNS